MGVNLIDRSAVYTEFVGRVNIVSQGKDAEQSSILTMIDENFSIVNAVGNGLAPKFPLAIPTFTSNSMLANNGNRLDTAYGKTGESRTYFCVFDCSFGVGPTLYPFSSSTGVGGSVRLQIVSSGLLRATAGKALLSDPTTTNGVISTDLPIPASGFIAVFVSFDNQNGLNLYLPSQNSLSKNDLPGTDTFEFDGAENNVLTPGSGTSSTEDNPISYFGAWDRRLTFREQDIVYQDMKNSLSTIGISI